MGERPDLKAIREGLDGVTAGPWEHFLMGAPTLGLSEIMAGSSVVATDVEDRTAAHIARLDPDTVRWLLDAAEERDRLREAIERHRANIWGTGSAAHPCDEILYEVLNTGEAT